LGALLKAMELRGEIVLVGHSMGAFYNLAFMQQHPGVISSLIWLDPTHPDQLPRSRRMQSFFFFLEFAHLLAARNLPSITLRMVPHLKGLPELDFAAVKSFLKNPRHLKTTAREARAWKLSADYVREINLNNQPLLIVSAQKSALRRWAEFQKEMAQRSSKTRHVTFTDVSHLSMLANREHARRVAREIRTFVEEM
jgi:pimeloyl-ACP methyl ester carboxylesterase